MSKSRWGGFRVGKRVFKEWDILKSSSVGSFAAPISVQDFDYTTAQGIWNLQSTTQFKKKTSISSLSFVASSVSSATTITFPTGTQSGDLVVLIEFSTTVTPSTPSGWTNIGEASTTGMLGSCSYKVVTSDDLLSSVSGIVGTTRKTMLAFRPNGTISSVTTGSINGQATTSAPTNQSLIMSGVATPVIGIAHYATTSSSPTRGSSGLTMTEVNNTTNQNSRYVIFNQGDTPTDGTITMTDGGTNVLQSFYLKIG